MSKSHVLHVRVTHLVAKSMGRLATKKLSSRVQIAREAIIDYLLREDPEFQASTKKQSHLVA